MDNQEDILDALRDFEKKPALEIPPLLDEYLGRVASTGETLFPWPNMKALFVKKLDGVMQQFEEESHMDSLPPSPNVENVKFEAMRTRILHAIDKFHGAPFTIQRLCELITNPKKHYKRADKFLRGVEKNILVVSTVDPFGRKVVSESKHLVNGLDSNGHMMCQADMAQGEVTESITKTTSLAHGWSSEGVTSSSSEHHKLPFEEAKPDDMLCSDSSGEATPHKEDNSPEQSSDTPSESENGDRLQEEIGHDSAGSTEPGSSVQSSVTSVDNPFDNEKEIYTSVPDEETQNQPLVFTSSHVTVSNQAETVTNSTIKDSVSDTATEEKLPDKEEMVSSGEAVEKPQDVTEEEMSEDADSSSTVLPHTDDTTSEAASVSPSELEAGSGDAQKTEEPSSSDDEDRSAGVGAGDGGCGEAQCEGAEEGVSSSESSAPHEVCVSQPKPTSPCEQSPPDDTEPSQSSSSENNTAAPPAEVTEDSSSEAAVTCPPEPCPEITKSDAAESPESSSSPSVSEQQDIAAGENVSSSSESSGVAMETEESISKVTEPSSDSSTTENFCSTSDIPEPQTEEPMEQD